MKPLSDVPFSALDLARNVERLRSFEFAVSVRGADGLGAAHRADGGGA